MGYFDESETFKQSCPGGIKKEPIVEAFIVGAKKWAPKNFISENLVY